MTDAPSWNNAIRAAQAVLKEADAIYIKIHGQEVANGIVGDVESTEDASELLESLIVEE